MTSIDFANILFAGPCNACCPACIGRQISPHLSQNNLDEFPPRNLDKFIEMIRQENIAQVVLSGTTTDPQLYRYEARLLVLLRHSLPAATQLSLHTNGRMALKKISLFNQYDRVSLSFPSFDAQTYRRMMGVPHPPYLAVILREARVPVKISYLVTNVNLQEIPDFLENCHRLGVRRVVFRKLFSEKRSWEELIPTRSVGFSARGNYRGNPIYDHGGIEVTLWDFNATESTCINLFSTGQISREYKLAQTPLI
jgi:MoaA/NifB/PqqE/SkfB family radical SAM enzyme